MTWPKACSALADGLVSSANFRRLRAVTEVVETLGPCDGRHHARNIVSTGHGDWLNSPEMLALTTWGNPLRWPSFLLGVPHSYAPTSLRYLSHVLWLKDQGMVGEGAHVMEIGVGYGGLAAMNSLVSQAQTTLVDLPEVERAAMTMLAENGLAHAANLSSTPQVTDRIDCVVSNYAFTELTTDLQERFLDQYLIRATHGMILSNANVFSARIGGKSDDALLTSLKRRGIEAQIVHDHPLFSPADRFCRCALIYW
jgi:hypothetical protein